MDWRFEAIGTSWRIETAPLASREAEAACREAVSARIAEFDAAYSRFRDDSLVSRMAREAGEYELPGDAAPMLRLYRQLYEASDGAVTPLVGQLLSDAGYDAQYSLRQAGPLAPPPAWDEALEWDGGRRLVVRRPVLLDVGAAGKGYLVDLVAEVLESYDVAAYSVDAGGDLRTRGVALRVGLENPAATDEVIGVAQIRDRSICGSAGNRRAWGEFHHIIDPRTQSSPRHLQAVWVAAGTTMLADSLTTALFFVEPEKLRQFEFEYLLMEKNNRVRASAGFPAEIFCAQKGA